MGDGAPISRTGNVLLALVAAFLTPVLIWVALFIAVRQPLLRAAKRVGTLFLPLLAAFLAPVLIWVGLFVALRVLLAVRRKRAARAPEAALGWAARALKTSRAGLLVFVFALSAPVLIFVGFGVAMRDIWLRWRVSRLPASLVCRIDTDCPPGYVCVGGKCVPQY